MGKAILKPFEVSEDQVKSLEPVQLVQLIKRLIKADLQKAGIPLSAIQGSLKINVADGGEDIRVEWSGEPARTDYIPRRFTVFQLKAENLSNAKLRTEPFSKKGALLKPAVAEAVSRKGAYVIVTSKTGTTTPKKGKKGSKNTLATRLKEMRELLRKAIQKKRASASKCEIDVFGPPKIVDWVNSHPMIAIWMKQILGYASSGFAFQTIDDWSNYRSLTNDHFTFPGLDVQMNAIRLSLQKPREVVRLLGHSGLGKSRLTYEALKSSAENVNDLKSHAVDPNDLAPLVAYAKKYSEGLSTQIQDFIKNRQRVVVVVDECPPDGHRALSEEIHRRDSELSLITLDLDFVPPPPNDQSITIESAPDDLIKNILKSLGFPGPQEDVDRATKFCSGFPQVAVLVAGAFKDGAQHFADFQDRDNVVGKLVWGRDPEDPELMRCLRCLAIFDAVGISNPKDDQIRWIAEKLLGLTTDKLEEKLERLYERRILQKRGFSILVVPRPLAAQLSAMFWRHATTGQRAALLGNTMPNELKQALCERLTDLSYLDDARAVAAQLCEKSGPFGSAEALNTEIGARCLRNLAEVAPIEVTETLVREFGHWDEVALYESVGPGRRYLVWTLDALAWEPLVFNDAMRILLKLAASENETWGNNATGEFVQRFRVQLPGTSANFEQRLQCLSDYAENASDREIPVLIKALGEAIDWTGHSRTIGSEEHGTRKVYQDYRPKVWGEIFTYVKGCLGVMRMLAARSDAYKTLVQHAIASIDPDFVLSEPVFADYADTVRQLAPENETWGQLLDKLAWFLRHRLEGQELQPHRNNVKKLFDSLLPRTLEERIEFYVKSVPFNFVEPDEDEDDDEEIFNRNRKRAIALGHECAGDMQTFTNVLGSLSRGETRETFAFGNAIIESVPDKIDAINSALSALGEARNNHPNPSLAGGMLLGLAEKDQDAFFNFLTEISAAPKVRQFLAYFASLKLTSAGLALVVQALKKKELGAEATYIFGMGRVLAPISPANVSVLISTLRKSGREGIFSALDLLGMYTLSDEEKFRDLRKEIDAVLRSEALFDEKSNRTMANHHYETLTERLLPDEKYGEPLAVYIAEALINSGKRGRLSNDRLFQKLAGMILDAYPAKVLPIFAENIEAATPSDRWALSHILGSPLSFNGKGEGPLFKLDQQIIIASCRAYPTNFAPMVAEIAPLFMNSGNGLEWSDLGNALLNEFGHRKNILEALTRNIGTGGWTGPRAAHLRTFVKPLEQAKKHKKAEVRAWARSHLNGLMKQIAYEEKIEEEASIRGN